jgi:receptor protein-tyrosine kinase
MSLIEKAAQRLEQLRQAGIEVPSALDGKAAESLGSTAVSERAASPESTAHSHQAVHVADLPATAAAPAGTPSAKSHSPAEPGGRSKTVEIDLASLAAAGYITPEAHRSQIADEFRVMKRPIIKNAQGGPGSTVERGNCVMVTSALPSEGKTFMALNLAMSIASEVDSTVLLVDADVANPNLLKKMHLPAARGLLDLLTGDVTDLADVLLKTNVEKLSLLPAGSAHRRATEMLASTAMVELVEQMSKRYPDRILVFDSPPLLATTEARVLASHMGQIVMVVEADVTTQGTVLKALETIESCPIVLMVLNKAPRTDVGGYYGYGFYGATT